MYRAMRRVIMATNGFLHCFVYTATTETGHPDNVNQSQGRTETIDSNIFKSSQSICQVQNKEISTCLLTGDEYATTASVTFLSSKCLSFSSFACLRVLEVLSIIFVKKLYLM